MRRAAPALLHDVALVVDDPQPLVILASLPRILLGAGIGEHHVVAAPVFDVTLGMRGFLCFLLRERRNSSGRERDQHESEQPPQGRTICTRHDGHLRLNRLFAGPEFARCSEIKRGPRQFPRFGDHIGLNCSSIGTNFSYNFREDEPLLTTLLCGFLGQNPKRKTIDIRASSFGPNPADSSAPEADRRRTIRSDYFRGISNQFDH